MLTLIVFLPLVGALLIGGIAREREGLIRGVALGTSLVTFALAVALFALFSPDDSGMQFVEQRAWVPQIGVGYHLGVDGISLLLVLLVALIVPLALWAPWEAVRRNVKLYAAMILLLETALLGVFLALDLVLFYVFWEAMLIPMYFLIGIWGGERRGYAAIKFFLYTMTTSVLMLVAIIALYVQFGTFDWTALQNVSMGRVLELWLFAAFAAAFAVKVPIWPFHSWLPDAYSEAPISGSVLLAALLSKAGLYGLIRFGWTVFPSAAAEFAPVLVGLALVGVIYGALVAAVQRDLKRLIAYSSFSHVGLIAVGIFAAGAMSLSGSVLQMVNHGIIIAALFLALAVLVDRFQRRGVEEFGGVMKFMPRFAALFLIFMLASVALPGTNGFVGEFLILLGTFLTEYRVYAIIGASVAILSAVYMLWMAQRVFHNPPGEGIEEQARDLSNREAALLIPFALLILWIGIYPKPLLDRISPSVEALLTRAQARIEQTQTTADTDINIDAEATTVSEDVGTEDAPTQQGGLP
jgi:NADH-quinone oxidoreductase subunit M